MAKKNIKSEKEKEIAVVEPVEQTVEPTYVDKAIKEVTMIEKYQDGKDQSIAIRTYFDGDLENMGLESYGMSLFDGVIHEEELSCLEVNGIKRYITGLNEFAPEIRKLPVEKREAKIREIRTAVATLERERINRFMNELKKYEKKRKKKK